MEEDRETLLRNYAQAEQKLAKKDYIGNILYIPFDPDEEYFYTIDPTQRAKILDQLNQQFDVQDKLSVAKRTQVIDVQFEKDGDVLPVCVFARWSKGRIPEYWLGCRFFENDLIVLRVLDR